MACFLATQVVFFLLLFGCMLDTNHQRSVSDKSSTSFQEWKYVCFHSMYFSKIGNPKNKRFPTQEWREWKSQQLGILYYHNVCFAKRCVLPMFGCTSKSAIVYQRTLRRDIQRNGSFCRKRLEAFLWIHA